MKINRTVTMFLAVAAALAIANSALAQGGGEALTSGLDLTPLAKGIGAGFAGLAVVGGGPGIGRVGGDACAAVARQPEAAGTIFANMIITAGMIEGATLFAVIVGMLSLFLI